MNVDQNRMLSLTVKVLFSHSHFQNLRENAYSNSKHLKKQEGRTYLTNFKDNPNTSNSKSKQSLN